MSPKKMGNNRKNHQKLFCTIGLKLTNFQRPNNKNKVSHRRILGKRRSRVVEHYSLSLLEGAFIKFYFPEEHKTFKGMNICCHFRKFTLLILGSLHKWSLGSLHKVLSYEVAHEIWHMTWQSLTFLAMAKSTQEKTQFFS